MKLKNLNKRIQRLGASIAKDTKKLEKLRRKLLVTSKQPAKKSKKSEAKEGKSRREPAPKAKKKKKRHLSPEAREKLAAMMKERWAAKRAAGGSGSGTDSAATSST